MRDPELMEMIYDYVQQYLLEYKRTPTTQQIGDAMGIGKATAYRYLVDLREAGRITYDSKNRIIETDATVKYDNDVIRAAILGSVHCGAPQFEEENIDSYVTLPTKIFGDGDCYILIANGDSMIDAGIEDGDLVVVRKDWAAKDGDIVVALVDGESTLKIHKTDENGNVYLAPANASDPTYHNIYAHESMYVQGVAMFVIKQVGRVHSL